jgi:crotonobetainyl-CoA:carnitine CoA-transferase CaiB-like acyl-CoA transferase
VKVDGGELPPPTRAPDVGEHADSVLADVGYSPERIAALRAAGVIV